MLQLDNRNDAAYLFCERGVFLVNISVGAYKLMEAMGKLVNFVPKFCMPVLIDANDEHSLVNRNFTPSMVSTIRYHAILVTSPHLVDPGSQAFRWIMESAPPVINMAVWTWPETFAAGSVLLITFIIAPQGRAEPLLIQNDF